MTLTVDLARARAHWFRSQGLAAPADIDCATAIDRSGWLRTIGGVDVYLALRSRITGLSRALVDAAVGRGAVRVGPAVRGCIYLVPEADLPLALRTADLLSRRRIAREMEKVGVEDTELDGLGEAVLEALEQGPLTTSQIKSALPDGAVRRLGEVGKKIGVSSTLPPALRRLEFAGRLERLPVDDRLDGEHYVWRRPPVAPDLARQPDDPRAIARPLAERFFRYAGPATLDEFCKWSGLNKGQGKAGIAAAGLTPVRIEGYADEAWVHPADADALAKASPVDSGVSLLNFADNYLSLHRAPRAFADPAHVDRVANSWGRGAKSIAASEYLHTRALLVGDRLAGSWEWDPDVEAAVAVPFAPLAKGAREALAAAAADLTAFLRDELGHAKSTSIDSDSNLRKRVALVRAQGG